MVCTCVWRADGQVMKEVLTENDQYVDPESDEQMLGI